jgi:hypothetical protein
VGDQVLHIAVDVDCSGDEIRGEVCDGVRAPRPFSGWLGLIGALDTMMGSPRLDTTTAGAGTPDRVSGVERGGER